MRLRIRSLMGWIALFVITGALAMAQDNNIISCSSDDGQLHSCRVNTDQPIHFVRQRSDAQCVEGESYGINRGGVWVTNGCRADFAVGDNYSADNNGYYNQQGTYNNGQYDRNNDRNRDGYRDQNGNWHSRHHRDHDNDRDNDRDNNGNYSQNGPYNNGQYDRRGTDNNGGYNGGYVGAGQQHPSVYYGKYKDGKSTCSSQPGTGPIYCQTDGALSNATITKSNGQCQRGQNWDINPDGLWVADGCAAEFQIQR